jgi:hypothetical protein
MGGGASKIIQQVVVTATNKVTSDVKTAQTSTDTTSNQTVNTNSLDISGTVKNCNITLEQKIDVKTLAVVESSAQVSSELTTEIINQLKAELTARSAQEIDGLNFGAFNVADMRSYLNQKAENEFQTSISNSITRNVSNTNTNYNDNTVDISGSCEGSTLQQGQYVTFDQMRTNIQEDIMKVLNNTFSFTEIDAKVASELDQKVTGLQIPTFAIIGLILLGLVAFALVMYFLSKKPSLNSLIVGKKSKQ